MARTVTTRQLYDEIDAGTVPMILDVRNQDEFAAWQVEGTKPVETRNLPIWMAVEQIDDLVKEIPQDTIVICAHGNGSDLLLDLLADEGVEARITRRDGAVVARTRAGGEREGGNECDGEGQAA